MSRGNKLAFLNVHTEMFVPLDFVFLFFVLPGGISLIVIFNLIFLFEDAT